MLDYDKLGLKCGLEIHQQIDGKKLFCNCAAEIRDDNPHYEVRRRLRAVAGETGHLDIAAAHEMAKNKFFVYECYEDSTCLVELDEQPPNSINQNAFETSLQVAKMLNSKFVDQVHVMRKIVVDGSNTSGFQRTALISINGFIDSSQGKVSIPTIILEEDAAKIVKDEPLFTTYRLDRLGIPLMEISTGPDIRSPEHAREVAEKIGLILRSTGKMKRGLGTIRQDVNVSIKDGARIEIKGAQELDLLPKIVEFEALRQHNLLEIKKELERRNVKKVYSKIYDLSNLLKSTDSRVLQNALKDKGVIYGIKLECFKGLIGKELQPNKRLGTEFSERAKVALDINGLFHSDELPNYGMSINEVNAIKKELGCDEIDGFIIVADKKEKAERALNVVLDRAHQVIHGVPKEVRKANPDGTSSFLRPMPGAARMYPETDIPSIEITKEMISEINIPEMIEDKSKRYEKLGLGKDLAELIAKSEKSVLFDKFVKRFNNLKQSYIAELLMTSEKTIRRQFNIEILLTDEDFEILLSALNSGKISKESVLEILKLNKPIKQVISRFETISDKELENELKKIIQENKGVDFRNLIGKSMQKLRGKAPGQKIVELLKKLTS